jgi:biofilm PGA synthesis N-glycosyltransferase PgaC
MIPLSVLIAAKNEAGSTASTIDSIVRAGAAVEHIYLVSDGSTDATAEIARSRGVNVLALPTNGGKALAIAKGIEYFNLLSRYSFLALADADTTFESKYFAEMLFAFERHPNAAITCGRVKSRRRNWLTAWRALQYAMSHWLIKEGQQVLGVINVAAGCCSVFRTKTFRQVWASEPSLVEDMFATLRAHYLGLGVIYVRDAVVITADPQDLIHSYTRQLVRWNRGAWTCTRQFRMWGSTRKIALETQMVMCEGLLFSAFLLLTPLWFLLWPRLMVMWLGVDTTCLFVSALIVSLIQRRGDILFYMPSYILLRFVDAGLFVKSFYQAFFEQTGTQLSWLSATRY